MKNWNPNCSSHIFSLLRYFDYGDEFFVIDSSFFRDNHESWIYIYILIWWGKLYDSIQISNDDDGDYIYRLMMLSISKSCMFANIFQDKSLLSYRLQNSCMQNITTTTTTKTLFIHQSTKDEMGKTKKWKLQPTTKRVCDCKEQSISNLVKFETEKTFKFEFCRVIWSWFGFQCFHFVCWKNDSMSIRLSWNGLNELQKFCINVAITLQPCSIHDLLLLFLFLFLSLSLSFYIVVVSNNRETHYSGDPKRQLQHEKQQKTEMNYQSMHDIYLNVNKTELVKNLIFYNPGSMSRSKSKSRSRSRSRSRTDGAMNVDWWCWINEWEKDRFANYFQHGKIWNPKCQHWIRFHVVGIFHPVLIIHFWWIILCLKKIIKIEIEICFYAQQMTRKLYIEYENCSGLLMNFSTEFYNRQNLLLSR